MSFAVRLFVISVIGLLLGFFLDWITPYDDSDAPPHRSHFSVYKDALTGCEYIGRVFGGVTPRMGADGRQVCRK